MAKTIDINKEIRMIDPSEPRIKVGALGEIVDYTHEMMNIPEAWKNSRGKGVKVVVIDSGVPAHKDLFVSGAKSFVDDYYEDKCGHATAVGSVISAMAGNGVGIRGIAPEVSCYYAAALDQTGTGSLDAIVKAIYWAVDEVHADVINMSLGISGKYNLPNQLKDACSYAYRKGVVLFAASGNDHSDVNYPARYDSVIAVAAVDKKGSVASFSSFGPEVEFASGGVDCFMCHLKNGYACMSGTSFSSPAVCAVACLILSKHMKEGKHLTPDEVREHLKRISFDVGPVGRDEFTGWGIPVFSKTPEAPVKKLKVQSWWRRLLNTFKVS